MNQNGFQNQNNGFQQNQQNVFSGQQQNNGFQGQQNNGFQGQQQQPQNGNFQQQQPQICPQLLQCWWGLPHCAIIQQQDTDAAEVLEIS